MKPKIGNTLWRELRKYVFKSNTNAHLLYLKPSKNVKIGHFQNLTESLFKTLEGRSF